MCRLGVCALALAAGLVAPAPGVGHAGAHGGTQASTWVVDRSRHLAVATVAALNAEISALDSATGVGIVVAVVDSTSGYQIREYARALQEGLLSAFSRGPEYAVLLVWVPPQRAVEILVGSGLGRALPDSAVAVREDVLFPAFRRGAFDEGLRAGVHAIAATLRRDRELRSSWQRATGGGAGGSTWLGRGLRRFVLILAALTAAAAVALCGGLLARRRRRKCPNASDAIGGY